MSYPLTSAKIDDQHKHTNSWIQNKLENKHLKQIRNTFIIEQLLPIQAQLFGYMESEPILNKLLFNEMAPWAGPLHVNITELLTSSCKVVFLPEWSNETIALAVFIQKHFMEKGVNKS